MGVSAARSRSARQSATAQNGDAYILEGQVGFLLRRAHQRHVAIFVDCMSELGLTPTQFSALAKIRDEGEVSQNRLGRLIAMDSATILGVVQRLLKRGLVNRRANLIDSRSTILTLSSAGKSLVDEAIPRAKKATQRTLQPLDAPTRRMLSHILARIAE